MEKALSILEFDKILRIAADFTSSEAVKTRICALTPSASLAEAMQNQAQTTESARMLLKYGYPQSLSAPDITGTLKRCEIGGILSPRELLGIARLAAMARNAKQYLSPADAGGFPVLSSIAQSITPVKALEEQIGMCILSEDEIADGASGELSAIRRRMRNLQSKIKDMLDNIIRSGRLSKYLQDPIVTMRADRYVIPVKSECRSEIPGVVHDTSASGATLFIEPMPVVDANNEIRDLQGKEAAEIERILASLSALVWQYSPELSSAYAQLCELDFIFCKGRLSLKFSCSEPVLNDAGEIALKKARHPLIDAKDVVANDIFLGGNFDTLVITGPNTGGKTVTLKTLGLSCLMAAAGLHIPAGEQSRVAVFDRVFADIGDEQSIEQSLSTFSSHMKNIVDIVGTVGKNSLALFDELGAGTDPVEGAALAVAILEYLRLAGAKIAATTHYSELKLFALSTPGVCNASCEFDVATLRPTYRLLIGVPGRSNAFAISSRLGLDTIIIERAKALMSEESVHFEDLIGDLEQSRHIAEAEKQQTIALKREVAVLKEQLTEQKTRLETNRQKLLDEARREAKRIVQDAKDEAAAVIKDLHELQKRAADAELNKGIEAARTRIISKEKALDAALSNVLKPAGDAAAAPKTLKPGDAVEIVNLGQSAVVLSAPSADGNVMVQAGIMKVSVPLSNLRMIKDVPKQKHPMQSSGNKDSGSYTVRKAHIKTELDLRGFSLSEALLETDRFINDAYMAGLTQVSIIHGKGTGTLRAGIGDMLKAHRQVKSYRLGRYGEGETGVTIVELK